MSMSVPQACETSGPARRTASWISPSSSMLVRPSEQSTRWSPGSQSLNPQFQIGPAMAAQAARDDVAHGMPPRLFRRDLAARGHLVDQRVVPCDAPHDAVLDQVGAAVTGVREVNPRPAAQRQNQRRAHVGTTGPLRSPAGGSLRAPAGRPRESTHRDPVLLDSPGRCPAGTRAPSESPGRWQSRHRSSRPCRQRPSAVQVLRRREGCLRFSPEPAQCASVSRLSYAGRQVSIYSTPKPGLAGGITPTGRGASRAPGRG